MGGKERRWRRSVRQARILLLFVVLVVGAFVWFDHRVQQRDRVQGQFVGADGSALGRPFNLEVADSEPERQKGLMFRKPNEMAADEGMIFVFPEERVQSFWMKNTYIPLDMLFLDRQLRVVGLLRDVPILNEKPRSVGKPSQYVVELHAGTAERLGITSGARLKLSRPLSAQR